MKDQKIKTQKIVMTAMLAALVAVSSAIRIQVPADITGTSAFHLGNIMCALSGILLGPWFGGLAAGMGSAIYDMFNPLYISECWLTFLMKGALGLLAGLIARMGRKNRLPQGGHIWQGTLGAAYLGAVAGALGYAFLYLAKTFFYSGLLMHGLTPAAAWVTVISKIPATIFNAAVAIIGAPPLAIALYHGLKAAKIKLD